MPGSCFIITFVNRARARARIVAEKSIDTQTTINFTVIELYRFISYPVVRFLTRVYPVLSSEPTINSWNDKSLDSIRDSAFNIRIPIFFPRSCYYTTQRTRKCSVAIASSIYERDDHRQNAQVPPSVISLESFVCTIASNSLRVKIPIQIIQFKIQEYSKPKLTDIKFLTSTDGNKSRVFLFDDLYLNLRQNVKSREF